MSRRNVRGVTSRRSASPAPVQDRRDCSTESRRSRRVEVSSMRKRIQKIADRICPQLSATLMPFTRASFQCRTRSEEHTSELQSRLHLVCRLLLEKKKKKINDVV